MSKQSSPRCGTSFTSHRPSNDGSARNCSLDLSRGAQHYENAHRQHGAAITCSSKDTCWNCPTILTDLELLYGPQKAQKKHGITRGIAATLWRTLQFQSMLLVLTDLLTTHRTPLVESMSRESEAAAHSNIVASLPSEPHDKATSVNDDETPSGQRSIHRAGQM